jgi:pyruvate dehydrogenase E2 component (dihydrolipoamide acetyltransferase)
MTQAWWEVPHVTHHEVADITALERFRREHEEMVEEEGGKLSLTVLVLKAAVAALKEHPRFNASLDVEAEEIVLKEYYNLGLAVDTPDGLVVPVIRQVDAKSLVELSREIPDMVDRIRDGEASQEDLSGGTFTLTNPGPLGGTSFTPVVRYPEVAILGMAAARMEPVMVGDLENWEIEARLRLPLVLAFDHRVNDGADAARFMNTVVEALNDTDSLLLHA